jgi:hypothetical protein
MTVQLLHSEFPYIRGKFDFLFYQCMLVLLTRVPASSSRNGSKAMLSVEFFSLFALLDSLPPNPSLSFVSTAAAAVPFPPAFSAAVRNQSVGDDPMSHESKFVSFQPLPPVSKSRRSGKGSPSGKNAPLASEPVLLPLPPPLACWAWQLWLASKATASVSPFTLILRAEAILCRHAPSRLEILPGRHAKITCPPARHFLLLFTFTCASNVG